MFKTILYFLLIAQCIGCASDPSSTDTGGDIRATSSSVQVSTERVRAPSPTWAADPYRNCRAEEQECDIKCFDLGMPPGCLQACKDAYTECLCSLRFTPC